jgi:hypothetical protein
MTLRQSIVIAALAMRAGRHRRGGRAQGRRGGQFTTQIGAATIARVKIARPTAASRPRRLPRRTPRSCSAAACGIAGSRAAA